MLKTKNIASRQVRFSFSRLRTWARHIFLPNRSNYQQGFAHWLIFIIVIALVAFIGLNVLKASTNHKNVDTSRDMFKNPSAVAKLPSCQGKAFFSSVVIPQENMDRVGALGAINPGSGHNIPNDHLQMIVKQEMIPNVVAPIVLTAVLSPGDVHFIGARATDYYKNGQYQRSDWQIVFTPCKQFISYFAHVSHLDGGLKAAIDAVKPSQPCQSDQQTVGDQSFKTCVYNFDYAAKAGEQVGHTGGEANGPAGIDWGATDSRTPRLAYADQQIIGTGTTPDPYHVVCALDYYKPGAVNTYMQSLLPNRPSPRCGEVMQDKPGTIQGAWHLIGQPEDQQQWTEQLGILHDNTDPSQGVVAIGGHVVPTDSGFNFHPKSTGYINREPSQVTADGHVYCYQEDVLPAAYQGNDINGKILVQLVSSKTMKVEHKAGACSAVESLSKPITYVR